MFYHPIVEDFVQQLKGNQFNHYSWEELQVDPRRREIKLLTNQVQAMYCLGIWQLYSVRVMRILDTIQKHANSGSTISQKSNKAKEKKGA